MFTYYRSESTGNCQKYQGRSDFPRLVAVPFLVALSSPRLLPKTTFFAWHGRVIFRVFLDTAAFPDPNSGTVTCSIVVLRDLHDSDNYRAASFFNPRA